MGSEDVELVDVGCDEMGCVGVGCEGVRVVEVCGVSVDRRVWSSWESSEMREVKTLIESSGETCFVNE